jgi:hypothetical protein
VTRVVTGEKLNLSWWPPTESRLVDLNARPHTRAYPDGITTRFPRDHMRKTQPNPRISPARGHRANSLSTCHTFVHSRTKGLNTRAYGWRRTAPAGLMRGSFNQKGLPNRIPRMNNKVLNLGEISMIRSEAE